MTDLAPHAFAEDARNPFGAGRGEGQSYKFTLNLEAANTAVDSNFPLYKCAKDCWVTDPYMITTDMDAGGAPVLAFDLGFTSDDNGIMSDVAGTAAATSIAAVATQVAVPAGETISASVLTGAQTGAAGTLIVGFTLRNK